MKRYLFPILLAAEAVLCLIVNLVGEAARLDSVLSFPFAQIGVGLRALSLSGAVGNGVAVVLYAVLSLLPVGVLIYLCCRNRQRGEDALLVFLSGVLFATFYYMINPGLTYMPMGSVDRTVVGMAFGGTTYAILFAYLILRARTLFLAADRRKLEGYMAVLLRLLAAVFVFAAFGVCVQTFVDNVANTDGTMTITRMVLFLRCVVESLPYLLDVAVIFSALNLLRAMGKDRYGEETLAAAHSLSSLCAKCLTATLLAVPLLNLVQLIYLSDLWVVNVQVVIPVVSVAFLLAVLLLVKFIEENRQLKADNDLFI